VTQKGSLNAPDRLRFDVSQPRPVTFAELRDVERAVNARIRENSPVETRLMTPDEAVKRGAMALFGEKYGDEVRVVSMGIGDGAKSAYSIELCGGTHVSRTGDIGAFRILAESGVAAGIRRIEAVTGAAALAAIETDADLLAEAATALKAPPAEVPARIVALLDERKRLERQIGELQRKIATGAGEAAVEDVAGVKLSARNLGDVAPRDLKSLADSILKSMGQGVVALVSTADGKASIVVGVSNDLTAKHNAVTLVRAAAEAVGGKGGGGRRGVPGGGAHHRPSALLGCLGDRHGHAPVLERSRRVQTLELHEDVRRQTLREPVGADQWRVALLEGDDLVDPVEVEPRGVLIQQSVPASHGFPPSITRIHAPLESTDSIVANSSIVASTSRASAWWVTKESRASVPTPNCSIDRMETRCRPKTLATLASTPGSSATSSEM
jgi:hypothetical protein